MNGPIPDLIPEAELFDRAVMWLETLYGKPAPGAVEPEDHPPFVN